MTLMRTTQVNPAEEPFAMLSGKVYIEDPKPTFELADPPAGLSDQGNSELHARHAESSIQETKKEVWLKKLLSSSVEVVIMVLASPKTAQIEPITGMKSATQKSGITSAQKQEIDVKLFGLSQSSTRNLWPAKKSLLQEKNQSHLLLQGNMNLRL